MSNSALLFIHCLTGLHPGSGTALGVVHLPVQRERHTQWPIVPGSSLKGVLRASCSAKLDDRQNEDLLAAFGPETGSASDHAGALSISDARILAFPVRSLKGVFAWTTCPAALSRLRRDVELAGGTGVPDVPAVGSNTAVCSGGSPLLVGGDKLMLEEFEFDKADGDASEVANWIATQAVRDHATADRLKSHLAILDDDDFCHFVRHATEVTARIGLDYETKTVRSGALFYEEFLPPETLFYSLVTAERSRSSKRMSSGEILSWLQENVRPTLQIGGGESVGKGVCAVRFAPGGTE